LGTNYGWTQPTPYQDPVQIPFIDETTGQVHYYTTTQNAGFGFGNEPYFNVEVNQGLLGGSFGRIIEALYVQAIFWKLMGGLPDTGYPNIASGTGGTVLGLIP